MIDTHRLATFEASRVRTQALLDDVLAELDFAEWRVNRTERQFRAMRDARLHVERARACVAKAEDASEETPGWIG